MHSTKLRLVGLVAASAVAVSACGNGDGDAGAKDPSASTSVSGGATTPAGESSPSSDGASSPESPSQSPSESAAPLPKPDAKAAGTIAGVKVADMTAKAGPKVTFDKKPFTVKKLERRTLAKGSGSTVEKGQIAKVDYAVYNGTTGKQLETSFGKNQPASMPMDEATTLSGVVEGLVGTKVGDTTVVTIPAAKAFGEQGQPKIGVGPGDTMVFVIKTLGVSKPLTQAEGTAVKPPAGLPTVRWFEDKPAEITMPDKAAPKELVVQDLIQGKGDVVKAGQTVKVHYTGAIWKKGAKGEVFDSSYTRKQPADFPIGVGGVIKGWDKGLVGKKVGSRVLLVVPPDEGYGKEGAQNIKGTDTLVFVVDILHAG